MITVSAQDVTKKFNQHLIFSEMSFQHSRGILGISGANGSGKSTLMKCLAGLLRPNSGSIEWQDDGKQLSSSEVKAAIGYAAPYINLYAELSVIENLRFLLEAGGHPAKESKLIQLLERVQIPELRDQLFGSLSTGQQQRTKLAAALVRSPRVLMLDEPGSNLDEKGVALVKSIVQESAESGTMVILASNDEREIALCDEVLELS
ncbi:ABC transporter ATP-binding protein [Gracilimonas mengyeensis]|uniref:Heme ABC exporter, ATP-binding protein CcmA n=1 Tax=Gracilimonas mengyeensis TaxID=1302730 RepID=A0A521DM88_9BACT|nr:ABC transporter ATP-binding protein [Gracilimonas mengyeensis]SMO72715.1 heme ABC exporter, ATP-binding protein CcmA [Gracilimonas mengyeensis]